MKKQIVKRILSMTLILSLPLSAMGCGSSGKTTDLMEDITADAAGIELIDLSLAEYSSAQITDFEVKLFQNSIREGENSLVSPLAVLYAIAMPANGAEGETRSQIEETLGLLSEELNDYLYAYMNRSLKSGMKLANSIWLKDDKSLSINQDFLQTNADYYDAHVYQTPFNKDAVKIINDWVSVNTDGTVNNFLDEIPENAMMYLISTITFNSKWESVYYRVEEGTFTKEDGTTQQAEMMYGEEYTYLKDDCAQGFVKPYIYDRYEFVVLLPDEGISVSDYVASLTGEKLRQILSDTSWAQVNTMMPKFEIEYEVEVSGILKDLGMTDAFDDSKADFSGIGTYDDANISIGQVLHKTYIKVNEQGTIAGAVSADEFCAAAAEPEEMEIKTVYLDRPFVYMIIDGKTKIPVFMGTVMEVQ